jgi:hypothetical protein
VEVNISNLIHSSQQEYASFNSVSSQSTIPQFSRISSSSVSEDMEKLYHQNLALLKSKVLTLFEQQRQIKQLENELTSSSDKS